MKGIPLLFAFLFSWGLSGSELIHDNVRLNLLKKQKIFQRIVPTVGATYQKYESGNRGPVNLLASSRGFQIGILGDIGIYKNWVLEVGALFKKLNGKIADDQSFERNYLLIPFSAKYYFSDHNYGDSLYSKLGLSNSIHVRPFQGEGERETRYYTPSLTVGIGRKTAINLRNDFLLEVVYSRAMESVFNKIDIYETSWNLSLGIAF